jgi:4-hydroxy-tetrahydrodipicolinate synthase
LELTRHAQQVGADIVYIQTPMMETHGGEGVLKFFRYIADRTDIALGMFNSPSSGYVLTPAESARIYHEIPAVCAPPRRGHSGLPRAAFCTSSHPSW